MGSGFESVQRHHFFKLPIVKNIDFNLSQKPQTLSKIISRPFTLFKGRILYFINRIPNDLKSHHTPHLIAFSLRMRSAKVAEARASEKPLPHNTYLDKSADRINSPRFASTKPASTVTDSPARSGAVKDSSSKTRSITV